MKNRGRAYRCRKCSKIDRKARMVAHVFKEHVPMDRAPYYCVLCSFRCQDKKTLLEHTSKYRPHQREEANRGIRDLSTLLRRGANPVTVDEQYIEQLSKEDSAMWFHLHAKQAVEEDGNPFEEDEEDRVQMPDGKLVRAWALSPPPVRRVTSLTQEEYIPTPLDTLSTLLPPGKTSIVSSTVTGNAVTTSGQLPETYITSLGKMHLPLLPAHYDQLPPSATTIGRVPDRALPQPFILTTTGSEKISLYSSPEAAVLSSTPISKRSEQDLLSAVLPSTTDELDPLMRGEGTGLETMPSTPALPSFRRPEVVRRREVRDVSPSTPTLRTSLGHPKIVSSSEVQAVVETRDTGVQTDGEDSYLELLRTVKHLTRMTEEQLRSSVATKRDASSTADDVRRIERKVTAIQRTVDSFNQEEEAVLKRKPEPTRTVQSVVKHVKY